MKMFYNYLIYHGEGLPEGKKTDYLDFIIKNKYINKIKNKKQRHIIMNFNRHSDLIQLLILFSDFVIMRTFCNSLIYSS